MITEFKKSNQLASPNLIITPLTVTKGKENSKNAFTQTDFDYVANVQSTFIDDTKQLEHDNQLTTMDTTTFSLYQLPNEIIKLIFQQLSREKETLYECCLINKYLYSIAKPLLWENPFSGSGSSPESDFDFEERLLACLLEARSPIGPHIRHFYLRGYCWKHNTLSLLIPHIRNLVTLEIGNYYEASPNDAIHYLPRYCHHLTSLILGEAPLGRAFFLSLGQHCRQLRRLVFYLCSFLSPDTFELLADCPLEKFSFFSNAPDDLMKFMNEKTLADLGKFDTLTSLEFTSNSDSAQACRAVSRIWKMASNTTRTIVWPRLKYIDLSNWYDINDASFVPFIKSHPFLEVVHLRHANITDISLNELSMWLPSLTYVAFAQCSNISLGAVHGLIQHAHQLENISLRDCGTILASDFPEAKRISDEWMHINRLALVKIKERIWHGKKENHNNSSG